MYILPPDEGSFILASLHSLLKSLQGRPYDLGLAYKTPAMEHLSTTMITHDF